ncbi:MAG: DUF2062 domain-containing protein, partial [Bdellovibrionales bacterium]|nr:DUF2062 domain-containing protein [Bdellovibrionales bacterium]
FRSYPLFYVQHLKFYTKKYDFEIEVLIRLLWNKVDVIEVPIDVYYPPREERVSHFDKFRDNVKISLLNTVLVIFSLLKSNVSRSKIVTSISIGVFIGLLPLYGLHTIIAAFLSFIFRFNFPQMFLATNISIPPLIPVWSFISLKIGSTVTKTPINLVFDENIVKNANSFFFVFFVGSVILGLTMSIVIGSITFYLTGKRKKKKVWTGKSRGGSFGNAFMKFMTTHLGPKSAYFFLIFICPYFYLFAPKAVRSHNQYFKLLLPEMGLLKRQKMILQTFFKLGQILIDNIYSSQNGVEHFSVKKQGAQNVEKALTKNRGLILVGSHVGGWMFSAKIFSSDKNEGSQMPGINVVEFDAGIGHRSQDKINSNQLKFIQGSDEAAIFKISDALAKNEIMILMGDRVLNNNLELVPFLGKLAAIDSTPFKIAITKKTPISYTYGFKDSNQSYDLLITEPTATEEIVAKKGKDGALLELIETYTSSLEEHVRIYPTQWFNFFPFWSALPSEEVLSNSKKATHHL